jgi:hypothetical protein
LVLLMEGFFAVPPMALFQPMPLCARSCFFNFRHSLRVPSNRMFDLAWGGITPAHRRPTVIESQLSRRDRAGRGLCRHVAGAPDGRYAQ